MTSPLPCPFCGAEPFVGPSNPNRDGNCFGFVKCRNMECVAHPTVEDGELVNDDRGSDAYKERAIIRWNQRASISLGHVGPREPDPWHLCYIEPHGDGRAWFTTLPVDVQPADDWNDIPYEHNASRPYGYSPSSVRDRELGPWKIASAAFSGEWKHPNYEFGNSPWSVHDINDGEMAWLRGHRSEPTRKPIYIFGGVGHEEFNRLITEGGGAVWDWQEAVQRD